MSKTVAVLVGSLRKGSLNRKIAEAVAAEAPESLSFRFVEFGDVPYYNEDIAEPAPAVWTRLREALRAADAVLFATPEYNRSVPGALKNAIDVASRPHGQNSFDGKPAAVISASPGAIGGFGANHHLRQMLAYLNMPTMAQPEAYVGGANKLFDESGALTNDDTRKFLKKFAEAFAAWIAQHTGE